MFAMIQIPGFVWSAAGFLVSVGVLIVSHEWGHYIMAKRGGVPVEEFSIGFGPVLARLGRRNETTFNLRAIPVGGFVRMSGMEPGDDTPDGYNTKPMWTRTKIISAGVFVNIVLGMLLFVLLGVTVGLPTESTGKVSVGDVEANSPAQRAGLRPGDRVLAVNGTTVKDPVSLTDIIRSQPGKSVTLTIQRDGEAREVSAIAAPKSDGGKIIGRLGFVVSSEMVWRRQSLASSVTIGAKQTWLIASGIVRLVFSKAMFVRGNVGGPIAIAKQAGGSASRGLKDFTLFVAGLSINLGVLNLLPIPALDGGHMLLLAVEAVRRKRLQARTALVIQGLGFALLLSFICYATISDIFPKG